jgi:hypothetical protein
MEIDIWSRRFATDPPGATVAGKPQVIEPD